MTTVHDSAVTATTAGLAVWPASTTEPLPGALTVGGVPLAEVADRFGTPVYVLDESEVRDRCRTYRTAFPDADVLYAAKAFLCRAMAHWVDEEGLGLDVCSAGELELAVTTGFPLTPRTSQRVGHGPRRRRSYHNNEPHHGKQHLDSLRALSGRLLDPDQVPFLLDDPVVSGRRSLAGWQTTAARRG
ncbi:hypothetical protein ACIG54_36120 [Streptomyces achromogenes]|uniref:hypothetical protein n=1 Tax=Streptomyces achromogenes TaxID=67255 RepID=UPI0037CDB555